MRAGVEGELPSQGRSLDVTATPATLPLLLELTELPTYHNGVEKHPTWAPAETQRRPETSQHGLI